jgi:membrane protease YdiL (CAAX protease family)
MTENHVRIFIGFYLLIVQAIIFFSVFYLSLDYLEFDEALSINAIIAPVFSIYLTAIVKYFIAKKHSHKKSRKINTAFLFVACFFPVLFTFSIFFVLWGYTTGLIPTYENLRDSIAGVEIAFGVYLGYVIDDLFKSAVDKSNVP